MIRYLFGNKRKKPRALWAIHEWNENAGGGGEARREHRASHADRLDDTVPLT